MILRQFLHFEPVAISYLLGCGSQSAGMVVDPVGDIKPYLEAADAAGMAIKYVIDTHIHADHASAGRQLAEVAGAQYAIFAGAEVEPPFSGLRHGDVLKLGNVCVEILHTPGHTPEHISLLVSDKTRADEPWFVLTGHTLMVGDLGRTELATSVEDGARDLFASAKLFKSLPDHVEILPGAFAGSVCGRALSGKPTSTIGFEKRHNAALRIESETDFIRVMTQDIPAPPHDAAALRAHNAGKTPRP